MGPKDRVGVFSASGGVTIPFSGNLEFLRGEIQDLNVGKLDLARPYRGDGVRQPDVVRLTDLQAIRVVEGGHVGEVGLRIRAEAYRRYEETQAAVHRLLAGLALHLRYLRHFRASKALVLLSEGFVLGKRMRWRLDQVINRALRSRVLFHVVDIRGLYTVGFEASGDPLIFRDVRIHPVAADPIDRRQPVTFYYRLHNLQHPRESREMTARVQLTDESGRVSRFPLIALGEGMTQSWGQGRVAVVFNLSFKSVKPGEYRLTVMTRAPAAGGQTVIARSALTVAE